MGEINNLSYLYYTDNYAYCYVYSLTIIKEAMVSKLDI